jgi:hypothetical protein
VRQKVDKEQRHARTIEQPSVQIRQSFHLDRTYRAIAKIALNVVANKRGAEFALRSEFDPLRNYILGTHKLVLGPMPQGQVMVDLRFVEQLRFGSQAVPTKSHAVAIFYAAPSLLACVTLYENHSFLVRLAEIELSEQILEVHEFSTDRSGHKALSTAEIFRRLWELDRDRR